MTEHAVVIVGGGPTGLMLAGELALARVDVAIVERRVNRELAGSRAGGLHARTIEVLDQRGIADRFLAEDKSPRSRSSRGRASTSATSRPGTIMDSGFGRSTSSASSPAWVGELGVPIFRGREVTGFGPRRRRCRCGALRR